MCDRHFYISLRVSFHCWEGFWHIFFFVCKKIIKLSTENRKINTKLSRLCPMGKFQAMFKARTRSNVFFTSEKTCNCEKCAPPQNILPIRCSVRKLRFAYTKPKSKPPLTRLKWLKYHKGFSHLATFRAE